MQQEPYWRKLLHRWFVEYNPLYLISATLVLGGMILSSRGLAREGSLYGEIGVAAIAELYSLALIGGAAILMRLQHRRSAVMLALLTVLYQCDLTLHTETCPNLGEVGVVATAGWLAFFVAKLIGLGWAMKLRLSRGFVATVSLGGGGLALLPYALHSLEPRTASTFVAIWLFALVTVQQFSSITTAPDLELTNWGRTVFRRSLRATWALWGGLTTLHLLFWSWQYHFDVASVWVSVVPLAMTRFIRRESRIWAFTVFTLLLVGVRSPEIFAVTALLATVALSLRAWLVARTPDALPPPENAIEIATPYRLPNGEVQPARVVASAPDYAFVIPTGRGSMNRFLVGAMLMLYLSIWTQSWTGGAWPSHILALDLALAAALLLSVWRLRAKIALVPLSVGGLSAVVTSHLLPAPHGLMQWGATAIGLGFVLLIVSIAVSYYLRAKKQV